MKTATANGREVQAGPDAPTAAACPACGSRMILRRHGQVYAYHHITAVPDCPLVWRSPERLAPRHDDPGPEYFLFVTAIRQAIRDALDGSGPQALDWLFSAEAQAALRLLLERDEEQTLAATERAVERLTELIAAGQEHRLQQLVAFNAWQQATLLLQGGPEEAP